MLGLGLAAAIAFAIMNLSPLFFPEKIPEIIVAKEEVVEPVQVIEEPPAPSPVLAPPPVVMPVVTPAVTPAVSSAELAQACPVEDSTVINYKPEAPRKSADMVYVQTKSKQVVCVTDATGKNQNKLIEPGVGSSFYGKPPFKVLTGGLTQVDVYFQGAKVRLANLDAKTILLEATELVIPSANAQSDSELR
jgi:hypothetical protein